MKNLILSASVMSLFAFTQAKACGPFDFRILPPGNTKGVRGDGGGTGVDPKSLKMSWAEATVTKGKRVLSDTGFFFPDDWIYSDADSRLSRENTLVEMYGYFDHLLSSEQRKDPNNGTLAKSIDAVKKNILEASGRVGAEGARNPNYEGMSARQLMLADKYKFTGYLSGVLNQEASDSLGNFMARQNTNPEEFGQRYFSRASYLSMPSNKMYSLSCMVLGYAQDLFTNETLAKDCKTEFNPESCLKKQKTMFNLTASGADRTLVSSLTDYAATLIFENKKTREFSLEGLNCKLEPSSLRVEVIRNRCGGGPDEKFLQENPVVRGVEEKDFRGDVVHNYRAIQLGAEMFDLVCNGVNLSDMSADPAPVYEALGKSGNDKKISKETQDLLKSILDIKAVSKQIGQADDTFKEKLQAFSKLKNETIERNNKCHATLTRQAQEQFKAGDPSTGVSATH